MAYDLNIYKGTTYSLNVTLRDSADIPINLTGYSVSGFLKYKYSDTDKLSSLNALKLTPEASGVINLSIPHTGTSVLPITIGIYDVEIYHLTSGTVDRVLNGYAYIHPEVTY